VVGGDEDERVGVGGGKRFGAGDGAIKLDGLKNPTIRIHVVSLFVDRRGLYHEHETGGILGENREGGVSHLVEHGLIGETEFIDDAGLPRRPSILSAATFMLERA
jgi:hypothetical protein